VPHRPRLNSGAVRRAPRARPESAAINAAPPSSAPGVRVDRGDDPPLAPRFNQVSSYSVAFTSAAHADAQTRIVFYLLTGARSAGRAADATSCGGLDVMTCSDGSRAFPLLLGCATNKWHV